MSDRQLVKPPQPATIFTCVCQPIFQPTFQSTFLSVKQQNQPISARRLTGGRGGSCIQRRRRLHIAKEQALAYCGGGGSCRFMTTGGETSCFASKNTQFLSFRPRAGASVLNGESCHAFTVPGLCFQLPQPYAVWLRIAEIKAWFARTPDSFSLLSPWLVVRLTQYYLLYALHLAVP